MAVIANDRARFEVLNLGWAPSGHGPYLVRQRGYAPGDPRMQDGNFVLLRNGKWVLNLLFALLPEKEQEDHLFHSLAELSIFLDAQTARPVVVEFQLPAGVEAAELIQRFETCTHRILRGLRTCLPMKESSGSNS